MGRDVEAGSWCVLRTSGPSTLRLAASLQAAGLTAWTPTEHIRRRVPRKKEVEHRIVSAAPTYVFVRAHEIDDLRRIERADITPHPRFSIFRHIGAPVFIRHRELHALRQKQQASYVSMLPATGRSPSKPRGAAYDVGEEVKIHQGAFAGLTGYVESSDGLVTLLTVTLFGRSAGVKVGTLQFRSRNVPAQTTAA